MYAAFQRAPARPRVGPPQGGIIRYKQFAAPTRGWVTNENIARQTPGSAQILADMFPEREYVRLRGGSLKHATVSAEKVASFISYDVPGSRKLFAASDGAIFDITTVADPDVPPDPVVDNLNGDQWSSITFSTAAGFFVLAVNGQDRMRIYDGNGWFPIGVTNLYALDYENETTGFTVGQTVTGGTSGATGVIVQINEATSTTGTLLIDNLTLNFQNAETITDGAGGSADADGTETLQFTGITGLGSGIGTDIFSHIAVYRNRIYLVERSSMRIWYLPTNSMTGAAGVVTLAGILVRGGYASFSASWSLDAGNGLDDKFIAVSTEGEVVVFEGGNPADPNDWSLVGRYDLSPPMGADATLRAGGEIMVATQLGLIPVSAAVRTDIAAQGLAAVSLPIEPDWQRFASSRQTAPWQIARWPERNMAIVAMPTPEGDPEPSCLVVNLQTGAWALYRNWDAVSIVNSGGSVYFGTNEGTIYLAEVSGSDDGQIYYPTCVWYWDNLDMIGNRKVTRQARLTMRTSTDAYPRLFVAQDFNVSVPIPSEVGGGGGSDALWDSGLWDSAVWDGAPTTQINQTQWVSAPAQGRVFGMGVTYAQSAASPPVVQIIEATLTWEAGKLVV